MGGDGGGMFRGWSRKGGGKVECIGGEVKGGGEVECIQSGMNGVNRILENVFRSKN